MMAETLRPTIGAARTSWVKLALANIGMEQTAELRLAPSTAMRTLIWATDCGAAAHAGR